MPPSPLRPPPLSGLLVAAILLLSPQVRASDRPIFTPTDALGTPLETVDADVPADEREEGSQWPGLEGDEAGAPVAAALSQELANERLAELGYTGDLGAEAPIAFYLDPLAATSVDPLQLERLDPKEFDIPVVVNDMVKKWMTYFLGNGRPYFGRYLMRSTRWLPMMHAALEERGMPKDLVYLSMIESGFTTSATSYAAAAGLWQFMPATGRQYKLRVDWWMDERRDPEKATRAALDYLSYLHRLFEGDWWLAWASYNGGEGRVMKETRRHGTVDFWTLVERGALHSETQNYVPKLIAAAIIGKHPERYGFVGIEYQDAFAFDTTKVPSATGLDVIARCAGVKEEDLLDLNPALRRWAIPPDGEQWVVRLPTGTKAVFEEAFAKVPPEDRVTLVRHVVKKKESLASIAKKYGVNAEDVARLNHLTVKSRIKVGQELVVPARPGVAILASVAPEVEPSAPAAAPRTATKTHTVKSGDTLSGIAEKYDVTVAELQKLNGIRGAKILAGQKLKVSVSDEPTSKSTGVKSKKAKAKSTSYTVKRGDTLGSIAERYDCSLTELKSWNALKGSTIYPGQKLKIKQ